MFIQTRKAKRQGDLAHLHLLVDEGQIRAGAVVQHVEPSKGMGLKFEAMSERTARIWLR